jgi:NADH:ubiquinone oxidoreductase subunit 4 (subunit M)
MDSGLSHFALWYTGLFLLGIAFELWREHKGAVRFPRSTAFCVAVCGISLAIIQSRNSHGELGGMALGPMVSGSHLSYVSSLAFKGKYLATILSLILFFGGALFAPTVPLVRVRMSRVLMMQGLLIGLIQSSSMLTFLTIAAVLLLLFMGAVEAHTRSLKEDERGELRTAAFRRYQGVALLSISISIFLRIGEGLQLVPASHALEMIDIALLCLASAIVAGLFPFHAWVVPFLGAPRSTVFLPLLCIEMGMIFFLRIYAPVVSQYYRESSFFIWLPAVGLVYAALLFFGERRLKRIPAYLYLSHISLMSLSSIGFGQMGVTVSLLDAVNVLVAILGLMGVCALLTSRFGVRGVLAPSGLGALFPELAVCYLVCVLSLVGFPGTLGFINEEVMLGQGLEHHSLMVALIAVALTLNGFSSFRLFARIFYGQPFGGRDPETALLVRERVVIFLILALIVVNGMAPAFLVQALTDLGSY